MNPTTEVLASTQGIELRGHDDFVEIHVHDRLSRDDYDVVVPVLLRLADEHGKLRYLVFLDEFQGWEPAAFWSELKFDVKNRKDFGRIAVVGASKGQRIATEAASMFFSDPVKFFECKEERQAREWIGS